MDRTLFEDVCLLLGIFILIKVDFMYFGVLFNILLIVVFFEKFLEDFLFGTEVKVAKYQHGNEYLDFDKIEEGGDPESSHFDGPKTKEVLLWCRVDWGL